MAKVGIDHSLDLRKAVVTKLSGDAGVVALVSADEIYGEHPFANHGWPFIRYGLPSVTPYEASCMNGSEHSFIVHCHAKGAGMDTCSNIAKAVQEALTNGELPLANGIQLVDLDWVNTSIVRDVDEQDAYHAIVEFSAQTYVDARYA